jgi:hypothetical protein
MHCDRESLPQHLTLMQAQDGRNDRQTSTKRDPDCMTPASGNTPHTFRQAFPLVSSGLVPFGVIEAHIACRTVVELAATGRSRGRGGYPRNVGILLSDIMRSYPHSS